MAALRAAVGPAAEALGLELMGDVVGAGWSDAEAALLEEGMRLVGRDFRQDQLYCCMSMPAPADISGHPVADMSSDVSGAALHPVQPFCWRSARTHSC